LGGLGPDKGRARFVPAFDEPGRSSPYRPREALNLIKRIKRIAVGFRNFENYRIRALLHAGRSNWRVLGDLRSVRAVSSRQESEESSKAMDGDASNNRFGISSGPPSRAHLVVTNWRPI
jgi:hypothetical protein